MRPDGGRAGGYGRAGVVGPSVSFKNPAMYPWSPPGYSSVTRGISFSWRFSFHTVTSPIAEGVPETFVLDREEMYGEPFDIAEPSVTRGISFSWRFSFHTVTFIFRSFRRRGSVKIHGPARPGGLVDRLQDLGHHQRLLGLHGQGDDGQL